MPKEEAQKPSTLEATLKALPPEEYAEAKCTVIQTALAAKTQHVDGKWTVTWLEDAQAVESPKQPGQWMLRHNVQVEFDGQVVFDDFVQVFNPPACVRYKGDEPDATYHKVTTQKGGISVESVVWNHYDDPETAAIASVLDTVRTKTRDGKEPWLPEHKGTVSTFYAETSDAAGEYVTTSGWANCIALTGGSSQIFSATATTGWIGCYASGSTRAVQPAFFAFNTSAIGTDTISAAVFSLYGSSGGGDTGETYRLYAFDWSAGGLTTADIRTSVQLQALTECAGRASSSWSTSGYNDFTETGTNLQTSINKTGTTYLMVNGSRQEDNSEPTTAQDAEFYFADQTGTANDPKLVVTHAAAGGLSIKIAYHHYKTMMGA